MNQHHLGAAAHAPVNGYSHAVAHEGRLVVVSGQVPVDPDGNLVGPGNAEAQIDQVFRNIATVLAAAGTTMSSLVKLTVYLTERADLAAFRRVRDRYIDLEKPPASSLVLVAGLIDPDFRVEIDALADA